MSYDFSNSHSRRAVLRRMLALAGLGMTAGSPASAAVPGDRHATPPKPMREFRGAWVATVANMDWPSQPGLPVAQQKAELISILDRAVRLRLNAIIFQVRPACDALYASQIEPWSEYLTGQMGRAPEPFYDPLEFAVSEAHKRALELHAWFNPFRARYASAKGPAAASHISRTRPEMIRQYGAQRWLDPADKTAQERAFSVILDVVRRYDVNGVHIDDYFFPYPEKDAAGRLLEFPDDGAWKQYQAGGGKLGRGDWRRRNVNEFVRALYSRIKAEKVHVKFGISPFGIWRPGFPPQITGLDAFDQLYADAKLWLENGWCDYFAPQLYWAIQPAAQSYPALLKWWAAQNPKGRHIWPGNNSAKVLGPKPWRAEEIVNQIKLTRRQKGASGNIFWNMSSLAHAGLMDALGRRLYWQQALVPACPWLDARVPATPTLQASRVPPDKIKATWNGGGAEPVWQWVVQRRVKNKWLTEVMSGRETTRVFPEAGLDLVAVSAVDRCGNVSAPVLAKVARA